ncbi:hypothetical protein GIX45_00280 [Erwinia sp. CPCC 100877]|nr:hypothetical protein [Erwinia sp. CPCC 100877]
MHKLNLGTALTGVILGALLLLASGGQASARGMALSDYQLQYETRLPDVDNLSSLTWWSKRGILMATTNRPASILAISPEGKLLHRQAIDFIRDAESIESLGDNRFALVDEHNSRLWIVTISEDFKVSVVKQFKPDFFGKARNRGIEGLAWVEQDNTLWLAKERKPMALYRIRWQPETQALSDLDDAGRIVNRLPLSDISGMDYYGGNLLILSHESKMLLEVEPEQGTVVSRMSLRADQHGLKEDIPQAEGVTSDPGGTLYMVSEPNHFYRFVSAKKT